MSVLNRLISISYLCFLALYWKRCLLCSNIPHLFLRLLQAGAVLLDLDFRVSSIFTFMFLHIFFSSKLAICLQFALFMFCTTAIYRDIFPSSHRRAPIEEEDVTWRNE